jgi:plasmid replication initiation protein
MSTLGFTFKPNFTTMNDKELSVIKSNEIIEARYRLDVLEQKFILYMVSLINPEDTDFKHLNVKVADFEQVMNVNGSKWGNIYTAVREIIMGLNEKPLQIVKDDGTKVIINWISSAEIKPRTGVINFEFSERLKPYLLQLKSRFTHYKLNNILRLNSAYSIRMYEFLKSHQYKGGVSYGVEELKTILGVSDKYDDYRDFKKRVLNTAQQELTLKSDICFDYTEERENRRIVRLDFKVYENPQTPDYINPNKNKHKTKEKAEKNQNKPNTTLEKLVNFGFTSLKARELQKKGFALIKEDKLRETIEKQFGGVEAWLDERLAYIESEMKKRQIDNPQAYFLKCLAENYTNPEIEKHRKVQEIEKQQKQQKDFKADLEKQKKALSDTVWAEKRQIVIRLLKENPQILDDATEGRGEALFSEYNRDKSIWENFEANPIFAQVRMTTAIERQTPQYFSHLEAQMAQLNLLEKKVQGL